MTWHKDHGDHGTIYQRTVAAYREPDRAKGHTMLATMIDT